MSKSKGSAAAAFLANLLRIAFPILRAAAFLLTLASLLRRIEEEPRARRGEGDARRGGEGDARRGGEPRAPRGGEPRDRRGEGDLCLPALPLLTFFHMSFPPAMGFNSNILPSKERRTPATSPFCRNGTRLGPVGFFLAAPPGLTRYRTLAPIAPGRAATSKRSPITLT